MIQPLRRAHFRVWMVLTAVMYVLFVAGLLARRSSTPVNPNLHGEQLR